MKRDRLKRKGTVIGYFLFLLPIIVTVALAIVIYNGLTAAFDSAFIIIFFMAVYVAFITLIFCVFDAVRRKKMVDVPTTRILDATDRIAKGDFSVRIYPDSEYDTFNMYSYIMENVNKMAEELSKSEILKSEFISNVSHELKTPMSVIKSYCQALRDKDLDDDTRCKYVGVIVDTCNRMSALVGNILKLNKLENRTVSPQVREVDVAELLRTAVISFEEKAEGKGVKLIVDVDEVTATTEPDLLEIVFNNLISNAVKFTDCGGQITVGLKDLGSKISVAVKDEGVGMSKETGAHIFEKFYQGETSHSGEGNGLGLALVKRVVDILGGRIEVESVLGKGSTFTVTLFKEISR